MICPQCAAGMHEDCSDINCPCQHRVAGQCGYRWHDGWGNHFCWQPLGHEGNHRCRCDAELSRFGKPLQLKEES